MLKPSDASTCCVTKTFQTVYRLLASEYERRDLAKCLIYTILTQTCLVKLKVRIHTSKAKDEGRGSLGDCLM